MKKFKLYISGLYSGNVVFDETLLIEKLNPFTNEIEEIKPMNKDEGIYYLNLTKIDLNFLFENFNVYSNSLINTDKSMVVNELGETYSKFNDYIWVQRNKKFPLDVIVLDNKIVGFICLSRETCTILIMDEYEDYTILKEWKKTHKNEAIYPIKFDGNYMIDMKDGIKLSTDVYLPKFKDSTKKVPTILMRTPYGKENDKEIYYKYVQRGYAVVIQDVRGRNESEGKWEPMIYEREDGDSTINWIVAQDWSNEVVGMMGASYLGYVQWAAASSGNKHLKALISIVTAGSPFIDIPRKGGAFVSGMLAWAFMVSRNKVDRSKMLRDDWDDVLNIRPIQNIPIEALGYRIEFLEEWIKRVEKDEYWDRMDWHLKKDKINVPALVISGWYDDNGMGTTEALDVIKNYERGKRKAILGPWMHNSNTIRDINDIPFGDNSLRYDVDYNYLLWFDKYLKGVENDIDKTAPIEYYSVGSNEWKMADNWPIANKIDKSIYLISGGNANTSLGDGKLSFEECSKENYDSYIYNPKDPSIQLIDMSENEVGVPNNYKDLEKRSDMLCYTSDAFSEEFTITGDIKLEFFASSSAKDTDWVIKIMDVDLDGNSIKLADGILSARFRNSFYKSEFMEEGEIYKFTITTSKISNTFKTGHRIRLDITSSAKNFIFQNSNTEDSYNSIEYIKAKNTIYHGGKYPSRLILPIENN
ncbi:CocE/NonD family hydrolase [Clostridioides sp. ES-S-0123-01]|uniref:CocE/NonD family hydrolase n=1 Tax=Clostridioides sp. ES-S-0123-01 TaxID=2770783 RepID=UPI001D1102C9|nr:CocE/NonD family hydrolase [Clostridioides sp. ES-S-0123-01]